MPSFGREEIEMQYHNRILPWVLCAVAAPALLVGAFAAAQTQPAAPSRPAVPAQAANAPVPTEKDIAVTQEELIKLLRLSPTLTTVVAHDPTLLANQDYVSRNNPQLAQFLASHPEIGRNPEFYLFTHLEGQGGRRDQELQRAVWPELPEPWHGESDMQRFAHDLTPVLGFACFLGAIIWLVRVFLENRRWGRIFKLQSEVHGRLIDKFSSNQELSAYMETEAGKRFLEAAPIPVGFEPEQRMPNAVARVLTPLQIGIVLVLLGMGFMLLRHVSTDAAIPMLILGTVAIMPGLGFIISAGITWVLAGRLGLMPEAPTAFSRPAPPIGSQERE
jgi:hypothetical protein